MTQIETLDRIATVAVPQPTKSYVPIKHTDLVNFIKERLDKEGLIVETERYETNKKGSQFFGHLGLASQNSDMRMALGFRNSYDKSLPVGFAAGAQVIVCSNLMLSGDMVQHRKHTTNVQRDLDGVLGEAIQRIEETFVTIEQEVKIFQETELSMETAQQKFGEILMNRRDVATPEQVLAATRFFKNPLHNFGNETVWGFYNAFTEALKNGHAGILPKQYLKLHEYVKQLN